MQAKTIKNALDALLAKNANGAYQVQGTRDRSTDALSIKDLPQVSTHYESGEFPRAGGSYSGPFRHDITFKIDLLVACEASVDLAVMDNPEARSEALAQALAAASTATARADERFDSLAATLWDILMRPQNADLGLDDEPNRWVTGIVKNDPAQKGSLVLLSGTITLTASAWETPAGETPVTGKGIDGKVFLSGDITGSNLDSACQGVKEGE